MYQCHTIDDVVKICNNNIQDVIKFDTTNNDTFIPIIFSSNKIECKSVPPRTAITNYTLEISQWALLQLDIALKDLPTTVDYDINSEMFI